MDLNSDTVTLLTANNSMQSDLDLNADTDTITISLSCDLMQKNVNSFICHFFSNNHTFYLIGFVFTKNKFIINTFDVQLVLLDYNFINLTTINDEVLLFYIRCEFISLIITLLVLMEVYSSVALHLYS